MYKVWTSLWLNRRNLLVGNEIKQHVLPVSFSHYLDCRALLNNVNGPQSEINKEHVQGQSCSDFSIKCIRRLFKSVTILLLFKCFMCYCPSFYISLLSTVTYNWLLLIIFFVFPLFKEKCHHMTIILYLNDKYIDNRYIQYFMSVHFI